MTDSADRIALALERVATKLEGLVDKVEDHESRVRGLERWRWILVGAGSVIGAIGAWIAKHF